MRIVKAQTLDSLLYQGHGQERQCITCGSRVKIAFGVLLVAIIILTTYCINVCFPNKLPLTLMKVLESQGDRSNVGEKSISSSHSLHYDLVEHKAQATPAYTRIKVRVHHQRKVCDKLRGARHYSSGINWKRMFLVDDSHRLIYCEVPKAGCTSWKTALASQSPNWRPGMDVHVLDTLIACGLKPLRVYTDAEILEKMRSYTIFMVARDPVDRLLSAYKDKMLTNLSYDPQRRANIIKRERKKANENSYYKQRPTLAEYVAYIADVYPSDVNDIHWMSMYDLCSPCTVNFTHVLKLEFITKESDQIFSFFEKDDGFGYTRLQNLNRIRTVEDQRDWCNLPVTLRRRIEKTYAIDYDLFSYNKKTCPGD